jgi:hypothetical protein
MLMEYAAPLVFLMVFLVILVIIYNYWSYLSSVKSLQQVDHFRTILTIISTVASVVFGSAVVLQVLNYTNQRKIEEIDYYSKLSREFLDEILELFINNMDMAYYYDDLLGINKITDKTKRNYPKEHAISMLIFSKSAKFAIFELESTNEMAKQKVQRWLGHVMDTLMQSKILRDYWTNEYKPKLSGPATQTYMKNHFNL